MKHPRDHTTRLRFPCVLLLAGALFGTSAVGAGEAFPFVIPGSDDSVTATHVASLASQWAGAGGPVRIVDGHFADSRGERLRLLGVNFSFGANFPEHADSKKVAAHLAKLGINAVRHHHMDARDIWQQDADGTRRIDPAKLEKLAYLITQLANNGIYSNINLHVSRSVTRAEGFPGADQLPGYNKYVLYFDERLQRLLKDYARTLLTYRNPHTGRRLADEPSLVTVEITNENRFAVSGHRPVFSLPQRYQDEFARRWNVYLKEKYGTMAALNAAWNSGSEPLGDDIADFNDFGSKANSWSLQTRGDNQASLDLNAAGPEDGTRAIHITIERAGGAIHELELSRRGLTVEAGKLYTVSFWIRSAKPRAVYFDVSHSGDPWQPVGIGETIQTTQTWQQIVRSFRATESLSAAARWIFKLGANDGDVYFASPHLQAGGDTVHLSEASTLEAGTIPVPRSSLQRVVATDIRLFMEDTEKIFFEEMARFLKEEIGVKAPVTGSQAAWQSLAASAPLDFVDAHAYWQHPRFPRRSWDSRDWDISNTSMLLNPGNDALSRLAWHRIWGKPYTVSEYNHPAPNDYQVECIPLLCAIAALQDWDGVYVYSYQHGNQSWNSDRIQQFFDINGNPTKLALLPTGAMLFRRQDLQPAHERFSARLGSDMASGVALQHRVGTHLDAEAALKRLARAEDRQFASDTGELHWDGRDKRAATFSIDTPKTKLALGFIASREVRFDGLHLEIGSISRGFGLIALTSLDGTPLAASRRMLLTTLANANNEGAQWNDSRTSLSNRWGTTPPMVEIVPARITIERGGDEVTVKWTAFPLDPKGQRRAAVPVEVRAQALHLKTDPADKAVWYEIVGE